MNLDEIANRVWTEMGFLEDDAMLKEDSLEFTRRLMEILNETL